MAVFALNIFTEKSHNFIQYIISSLMLFLIYFITKKIMKNKLGQGDIYFAIFTGLSLKPFYGLLSVLISTIGASLFFAIKTKKEQKHIAFIPFMSLGLIVSYIIQLFCSYSQIY